MPEKEASGAWLKVGLYRRSTLAKMSKDAQWAWWTLQAFCADDDNGGRVPKRDLVTALNRQVPQRAADKLMAELVEYQLTVDDGDAWTFPRFAAENPSADTWHDPVKRERWARDKRLKRDGELCRRIQARDRNLCRYCGTRVNWNDKVSPRGGTYDHVDPDGENSFANVVVSCRLCNGRKADRTPEQWIEDDPAGGRTLLRAGTALDRGSTPGQPPADPRPALPARARATPDRANPGLTGGQVGPSRHQDETAPPDSLPVLSRNGTTHHDGGT